MQWGRYCFVVIKDIKVLSRPFEFQKINLYKLKLITVILVNSIPFVILIIKKNYKVVLRSVGWLVVALICSPLWSLTPCPPKS